MSGPKPAEKLRMLPAFWRRPHLVPPFLFTAVLAMGASCASPALDREDSHTASPAVRYQPGSIYSPLSEELTASWAARMSSFELRPFIKVGDSITVAHGFLRCFGEDPIVWPKTPLMEGITTDDLQRTVDQLATTEILGVDPFRRVSQAACGGKWAGWATKDGQLYCSTNGITNGANGITDVEVEWDGGWPPGEADRALSPIEREITRADPGFALVMFGTNDLGNDIPRDQTGALRPDWWPWRGDWYADHLLELVDEILAHDVLPILYTIPPRTDVAFGADRVAYHNQIVRAVAASRRIPLIDYHLALTELIGRKGSYGLWGDGVHPSFLGGRACEFSPGALESDPEFFPYGRHGQNIRNQVSIEMLARLVGLLSNRSAEHDPEPPQLVGVGTLEAPVIADGLPFSLVDRVAGAAANPADNDPCAGFADGASAGQRFYRVTAERDDILHIRALARVRDGSRLPHQLTLFEADDVDGTCIGRQSRYLRQTVEAGKDYLIAVEAAAGQTEQEQEFVLVVWH